MKRLFTLITAAALLICVCGCDTGYTPDTVLGAYGDAADKNTQSEPTVVKTDISALFYKDMDTNPVTSTCYANHELLKLVYSPLIRADDSFSPICVLAESFDIQGDTLTVRLKSGLKFSDGSNVSAYDAVKSFDAARKAAESPYNAQTAFFKKYYAKDDLTFVCVVNSGAADPALLLDIPIMKKGESGVGCGPYVFSEKNGKTVLIANSNYFEQPSVQLIYLMETKYDQNISSLFSSGELDVVFGAQSSSLSLTSLRDYSIVSFPSNNFVYIGINHANEQLSQATVRKALSVLSDRVRLASKTLAGLADAVETPFNSCWSKMSGISPAAEYSLKQRENAAKSLAGVQFNMIIPTGSDAKKAIADALCESFKNAGLTLNVTELEPQAFTAALQTGAYDLFLGETAIPRTMDPTYLYSTGGSLNYGGFANAALDEAYAQFMSGDITLAEYLRTFSEYLPIIPLLFRKNVIYCDKHITGFCCQSPWNSMGDFTKVTLAGN